jgi:transporter family protein
MVTWLGFSLMAMGLWGLWGFFSKVASRQLPPQVVYLVAILGHLVVIAYLLAGPGLAIPWRPWDLAVALMAGICMAFGLLCFFWALSQGTAIVVVPLTALYPMITVLLCWLLLRESVSPRQLLGVGLAMLAVWLMSR